MTYRDELIKSLALAAYCDQYNETAELPDSDKITPDTIDAEMTELDDNTFYIDILDDDCSIRILALDLDSTTDRFATDHSSIRFFLSADNCAYISLPK